MGATINSLSEFSIRLRELRGERSDTEFANYLGVARQSVESWINGKKTPNIKMLVQISNKSGVSVDWLLGLAPRDNPSNDEKMRITAEYTGLSDDAIKYLHALVSNKNAKAHLDIINSILSDKKFDISVIETVSACRIKSNLNQEWVEIQLNDTESFNIRPKLVFGIEIKHAVDLYEEVIKKIVEEA